jgi:hypothetical protein
MNPRSVMRENGALCYEVEHRALKLSFHITIHFFALVCNLLAHYKGTHKAG